MVFYYCLYPLHAHTCNNNIIINDCLIAGNCIWRYGKYSECNAKCIKERYPEIIQPVEPGGMDCPQFVHDKVPQEVECDPELCKGIILYMT